MTNGVLKRIITSAACVCQDSFSTTERGSSFRSLLGGEEGGGGGAIVFRPNVTRHTRHTQPQRDHKYVLCLCLSNVWVIAERFIAASQLENNYMFTSFIIYRLILCRVADMLNRSQHGWGLWTNPPLRHRVAESHRPNPQSALLITKVIINHVVSLCFDVA